MHQTISLVEVSVRNSQVVAVEDKEISQLVDIGKYRLLKCSPTVNKIREIVPLQVETNVHCIPFLLGMAFMHGPTLQEVAINSNLSLLGIYTGINNPKFSMFCIFQKTATFLEFDGALK